MAGRCRAERSILWAVGGVIATARNVDGVTGQIRANGLCAWVAIVRAVGRVEAAAGLKVRDAAVVEAEHRDAGV